MSKAPAFQFYPSDWLEKKVLRMSDAAQGIYIRLLCYMWNDSQNQCSIENNDKIIAKLLGISSRKWKKYRAEIMWINDPILVESNGYLYSRRLEKEKEKQMIKSVKAQNSAQARWMPTQCERISQASHSHTSKQCSSSSITTSLKEKPRRARAPAKQQACQIDLPAWLDPKIWSDFLEHRKAMKKPMTEIAQKRALQKLTQLKNEGQNPNQVISESIIQGWQGLFPIKPQNSNHNNDNKSKMAEASWEHEAHKKPPCDICRKESVGYHTDEKKHLCRTCWPAADRARALKLINNTQEGKGNDNI